MTGLPTQITLTEEEATEIARLNAREQGLSSMTKNFQDQFEARAQQLATDNRTAWKKLADKYQLDLQRVLWQASPDGKTIIPVQVRLG